MLHTLYIYPPLSIVEEVKSGIDSKDDSILTRLLSLSPLVFFFYKFYMHQEQLKGVNRVDVALSYLLILSRNLL